MGVLRIWLFGGVRVAYEDGPCEAPMTRTIQALLAYLVLHRNRVHPREVLVALFWGDESEERGRRCLSTALWRLRQVLEPAGVPRGTYLFTTPATDIGFNCSSSYWLDVAVFEDAANRLAGHPAVAGGAAQVADLEQALRLVTGELLEGFYDDWALQERERLRLLYLDALAYLMRHHRGRGDYEASLNCGRLILQHDPLREEIHREVMRVHVESGQPALAIRQYELCRHTLLSELGIAPMHETRALYAQLVPDAGGDSPGADGAVQRATLHRVLRRLRVAIQEFAAAQEELQHAVRLLEDTEARLH